MANFQRSINSFTKYSSKVINILKKSGINENEELNLQLIINCFAQGMSSVDCAQTYLNAQKSKGKISEMKEIKVIPKKVEVSREKINEVTELVKRLQKLTGRKVTFVDKK